MVRIIKFGGHQGENMTPDEARARLKVLDEKFGYGEGASKEREKCQKIINDEKDRLKDKTTNKKEKLTEAQKAAKEIMRSQEQLAAERGYNRRGFKKD